MNALIEMLFDFVFGALWLFWMAILFLIVLHARDE